MLVEKKLSEALKEFDNGKAVLVLTTMVDGSVCCDRLEDLFPEDTHFLVNVPAYANTDFEAAVKNMVHRKKAEDDNPENKPLGCEELPTHNLKELGKKRGRKTIKDYDADRLKKLVASGKNNLEIAEELQVAVGTVVSWLKEQGIHTNRTAEIRRMKEKAKEEAENGPNADRHLCETCKFRAEKGKGCDYIIITGKQRGCDPGECNVYEKGNREG